MSAIISVADQTKFPKRIKAEEVKKVAKDLKRLDLSPLKFFTGNKEVVLTGSANLYDLEIKRPFMVLEVGRRSANGRIYGDDKFIYKREVERPGAFESIKKEAVIYRAILPEVYERLTKKLRKKVYFPELVQEIREGGETKAVVREKIEGRICGTRYANIKNIWGKEDVKTVTCVIKEFQNVNPEKAENNGFGRLPEMDFVALYRGWFDKHRRPVERTLGVKYLEKMERLFEKYKEIIARQSAVFLSEEIFGYNIIKMRDGRLGFIDWERPYVGKDASSDYGKFISRLWVNPKRQEEAIKIVLEMNKSNPCFKDLLKATLVGHLFHYYYKRLGNVDAEEKKEAARAVGVFKNLYREILDGAGVWK